MQHALMVKVRVQTYVFFPLVFLCVVQHSMSTTQSFFSSDLIFLSDVSSVSSVFFDFFFGWSDAAAMSRTAAHEGKGTLSAPCASWPDSSPTPVRKEYMLGICGQIFKRTHFLKTMLSSIFLFTSNSVAFRALLSRSLVLVDYVRLLCACAVMALFLSGRSSTCRQGQLLHH